MDYVDYVTLLFQHSLLAEISTPGIINFRGDEAMLKINRLQYNFADFFATKLTFSGTVTIHFLKVEEAACINWYLFFSINCTY